MPVTEKSAVFEGFTTPGPETVRVETKAVEAWNEPAFVEQIAAAGFPGSSVHTDEAFRYHLFNFQAGPVKSKKEEPKEHHAPKEEPHKKEEHNRKGH